MSASGRLGAAKRALPPLPECQSTRLVFAGIRDWLKGRGIARSFNATGSREWLDGGVLGDVRGKRLLHLHFPEMVRGDDGWWRLPGGDERFPLLLLILATKR